MAFTFISSVGVGNNGIGPTTTGTLDTTSANFLVVTTATYQDISQMSDSQNNSWYRAPLSRNTDNPYLQMFYCVRPTTNASHTFTHPGGFPGIWAAAFSFSDDDIVTDNESRTNGVSDLTLGSRTPSADNCLIVSGFGQGGNSTVSINGGFTKLGQAGGSSAQLVSMAYLIQTSAAASSPTWSGVSTVSAASQVIFREVTAGGGGSTGGSYAFAG